MLLPPQTICAATQSGCSKRAEPPATQPLHRPSPCLCLRGVGRAQLHSEKPKQRAPSGTSAALCQSVPRNGNGPKGCLDYALLVFSGWKAFRPTSERNRPWCVAGERVHDHPEQQSGSGTLESQPRGQDCRAVRGGGAKGEEKKGCSGDSGHSAPRIRRREGAGVGAISFPHPAHQNPGTVAAVGLRHRLAAKCRKSKGNPG